MITAATIHLTLTDALNGFSCLKQPCRKTYPVVVKNMLLCFRSEIIGLNQAKKTAEMTGIGLGTGQHIIKTWKDGGEPSTSRKKRGQEKISNARRALKRLVKWNGKKLTVELTAMFNGESTNISTSTMRRKLKGLGLNSCVASGTFLWPGSAFFLQNSPS